VRISTLSELMIQPVAPNDHAQAQREQIGDHATARL